MDLNFLLDAATRDTFNSNNPAPAAVSKVPLA